MMELDAMNILAMLTFTVLIIAVSLAVIQSIGNSVKNYVSTQTKETFSKIIISIFQKTPYNICEALSDRQISSQEFQNILLAVSSGQCGSSHATVILSRSYSKEDMEKIAKINGMAGDGTMIYYREGKPLGIGGMIIQGNPGYFPLKKWDVIEVWSAGKPIADTLIKVTVQGCDPYDEICQPACTYKKICDPACDDGQKHDITCNIACIDTDNNGIDITDMEARVAANKCNPDCYANRTNPFKAYDPGCVWKYKDQHDDICDPNSNGVIDGVCDPDCIDTKNMCDFDCNGTVYAGNPQGLKDEKCFVCDEKCNGWCSPACDKNAFEGMKGYDPDCRKEIDSKFWCVGDGLCEDSKGENCENSADCKQICDDQNIACCPKSSDADYAGCTATKDLEEGSLCSCDNLCKQSLKCDGTKHCCPDGEEWNGTKCEVMMRYQIVFVPIGYSNFNEFKNDAEKVFEYFVKVSPFKDCSDPSKHIEMKLIDVGGCSVSRGCEICGGCNAQAVRCVQNSEYSATWNKIAALCKGNSCSGACGCADGVPGDSSSSNMVSCRGELYEIPSHEMGHTFGLGHLSCDVACHACMEGDPNCPDCSLPMTEKIPCIMDYCPPMDHYCPAAYSYLKDVVFKDYLKDC